MIAAVFTEREKDMKLSSQEARKFRKLSGTSKLETVLRKVTRFLAKLGIPHLVIGGIAVQEHGYYRATRDVDIVVPDAKQVREALLAHGFSPDPKSRITVIDPSGIEVDVLQGGDEPVGGAKLPLPMPTEVSPEPQVVPLDALIETKLSAGRSQDITDVVQLIKKNSLPREYSVNAVVRANYEHAWSTATAEQAAGLIWKSER
jgi:hypothetical protein